MGQGKGEIGTESGLRVDLIWPGLASVDWRCAAEKFLKDRCRSMRFGNGIDIPSMASKNISFTVTPGSGVQSYWIAVDNDDVPLAGGAGALPLATGEDHFLTWGFAGNPGSTL